MKHYHKAANFSIVSLLGFLLMLGFLLIMGAAQAQTAQVSSFTSISNCALVLDANQPLYTTPAKTTYAVNEGDAVGCWTDTSGLGNDAVQATTASQPTLHLASGLGNPASGTVSRSVRLGTTTTSLISSLSVTSGGFTMIAVYQNTGGQSSAYARMVGGSANWFFGPGAGLPTLFGGSGAVITSGGTSAAAPAFTLQTITQSSTAATNSCYPGYSASGTASVYPGTVQVGAGSSGYPACADIAFLVVYTRILSATELSQVYDLMGRKLGYGGTQLAFYGNSLTYGVNTSGLTPSQINYAVRVVAALFGRNQVPSSLIQSGNPGYTSPSLLSSAIGNIDLKIWPTLPVTGRRIVVVWEITNDIGSSSSPVAGTVYSDIVALCQHFKTLGDTIILLDCIPRPAFTAAQETCRLAVNASLAADFSGSVPVYADGLVKVSTDATISSNIGVDGIHLNAAGYQAVANDVMPALTPFLSVPFVVSSGQLKRGR